MKNSIIIVAVLVVLGVVGVAAASQFNSDQSGSMNNMTMSEDKATKSNNMAMGNQDLTAKSQINMDIVDFDFAMPDITIKKGTTITWTNQDEAHHNVVTTSDTGPKSKLLATGESYSYTFETVGKVTYICEPHPYMKGTINVVE